MYKLLSRSKVTIKSFVMRDGKQHDVPSREVVPGDIVSLSAGSLIPADGVILAANDLVVSQVVLTGEYWHIGDTAIRFRSEMSLI